MIYLFWALINIGLFLFYFCLLSCNKTYPGKNWIFRGNHFCIRAVVFCRHIK